jgi:BirA family biotin operon repressor/biotin-[acetyl-CoA-carboxylase] ligase
VRKILRHQNDTGLFKKGKIALSPSTTFSMNQSSSQAKEKIIEALSSGGWISGERLGQTLGMTRPGVWKYISRLKEEGFRIESLQGQGYRLRAFPDILYPELIRQKLTTRLLGKKIHHFQRTDSTNTQARVLAAEGAGEGTLLVAEFQEKGKGRLDRRWQSPPGRNLLFSLILRPIWSPREAFYGTVLASVSLCRAIREVTGIEAGIKWPNDIYVSNKKLAGILTEMSADPDRIEYMIIGIGVNCNWSPPQPPPGGQPATSLYKETGKKVSRIDLLTAFLSLAEALYGQTLQSGTMPLRKEWDRYSLITNRRVTLLNEQNQWSGICLGIDDQGALRLRLKDGRQEKFLTGDVHLRI